LNERLNSRNDLDCAGTCGQTKPAESHTKVKLLRQYLGMHALRDITQGGVRWKTVRLRTRGWIAGMT
jgi:hypothetical protein